MAARDLPHPAISIKPSPYVDVVVFNPSVYESYSALVEVIANLIVKAYNSVAIDPLVEFSVDAQTFSKGQGKARKTGKLNLPLRSNVPNQGLWRFLKLLRCLRLRWLLRLTQRIIEERNKLLELRIRRERRPSHVAHTRNRYRGSYALVDAGLKLKTGKRDGGARKKGHFGRQKRASSAVTGWNFQAPRRADVGSVTPISCRTATRVALRQPHDLPLLT